MRIETLASHVYHPSLFPDISTLSPQTLLRSLLCYASCSPCLQMMASYPASTLQPGKAQASSRLPPTLEGKSELNQDRQDLSPGLGVLLSGPFLLVISKIFPSIDKPCRLLNLEAKQSPCLHCHARLSRQSTTRERLVQAAAVQPPQRFLSPAGFFFFFLQKL